MTAAQTLCDCCRKEPSIGVAGVPGMAISIAWCVKCLEAGVIPYSLAVANTAQLGGYDKAAEWWRDLVDRTLAYFGRSREEFDAAVAEDEKAISEIGDPEDQEGT